MINSSSSLLICHVGLLLLLNKIKEGTPYLHHSIYSITLIITLYNICIQISKMLFQHVKCIYINFITILELISTDPKLLGINYS